MFGNDVLVRAGLDGAPSWALVLFAYCDLYAQIGFAAFLLGTARFVERSRLERRARFLTFSLQLCVWLTVGAWAALLLDSALVGFLFFAAAIGLSLVALGVYLSCLWGIGAALSELADEMESADAWDLQVAD
jgi:hypothetical protein